MAERYAGTRMGGYVRSHCDTYADYHFDKYSWFPYGQRRQRWTPEAQRKMWE